MTAAQELSTLETVYAEWLAAGCPKQWQINGKQVQVDTEFMTRRLNELRAQVARQTSGSFRLSQFRRI